MWLDEGCVKLRKELFVSWLSSFLFTQLLFLTPSHPTVPTLLTQSSSDETRQPGTVGGEKEGEGGGVTEVLSEHS